MFSRSGRKKEAAPHHSLSTKKTKTLKITNHFGGRAVSYSRILPFFEVSWNLTPAKSEADSIVLPLNAEVSEGTSSRFRVMCKRFSFLLCMLTMLPAVCRAGFYTDAALSL
jgi:hypothetical protein